MSFAPNPVKRFPQIYQTQESQDDLSLNTAAAAHHQAQREMAQPPAAPGQQETTRINPPAPSTDPRHQSQLQQFFGYASFPAVQLAQQQHVGSLEQYYVEGGVAMTSSQVHQHATTSHFPTNPPPSRSPAVASSGGHPPSRTSPAVASSGGQRGSSPGRGARRAAGEEQGGRRSRRSSTSPHKQTPSPQKLIGSSPDGRRISEPRYTLDDKTPPKTGPPKRKPGENLGDARTRGNVGAKNVGAAGIVHGGTKKILSGNCLVSSKT